MVSGKNSTGKTKDISAVKGYTSEHMGHITRRRPHKAKTPQLNDTSNNIHTSTNTTMHDDTTNSAPGMHTMLVSLWL